MDQSNVDSGMDSLSTCEIVGLCPKGGRRCSTLGYTAGTQLQGWGGGLYCLIGWFFVKGEGRTKINILFLFFFCHSQDVPMRTWLVATCGRGAGGTRAPVQLLHMLGHPTLVSRHQRTCGAAVAHTTPHHNT